MAATNVIHHNVYVTPDTDETMRSAARLEGVTMARWIRSAIREKLKRETKNAKPQA